MDEQADIRARRGKLLNRARDLARSGRYADHRSIFAELETIDDFADAWGRVRCLGPGRSVPLSARSDLCARAAKTVPDAQHSSSLRRASALRPKRLSDCQD
jgi:hypothetical protein